MEKINVAELLKECPKGMELDCTMFEGVVFHDVVDRYLPIRVRRKQGGLIALTSNGCIEDKIDAKCIIFPKGKTTWEGFVPPCQFKDGDVIICENHWGSFISIFKKNVTERNGFIGHCVLDVDDNEFKVKDSASYFNEVRFATKSEKEQLFRAIKKNGYKWNEETKILEKLPKFKVGDKALAFGNKCTIIDAVWDGGIDEVVYTIKLDTSKYTTTKLSSQLQPYKEETMESKPNILKQLKEYFDNTPRDVIEKEWNELLYLNEIGPTVEEYLESVNKYRQSNQYPKTYEECCNILNMPKDESYIDIDVPLSYNELLTSFTKLLICRDAYWKIAGEQMGLGKPWAPDYTNDDVKFCICNCSNLVMDGVTYDTNEVFVFPTAEMRDAFYENFKDLIEQCKELL